MTDKYLQKIIRILERNTFFTAGGTILGLVALIISIFTLIALLK